MQSEFPFLDEHCNEGSTEELTAQKGVRKRKQDENDEDEDEEMKKQKPLRKRQKRQR